MILPTGPVWSFVQPHEPASRPVGRIIAQGQRNENQAVSRLRSTKSRREVPKRAQWTSCCPMTSGTSCGRKKGCRRPNIERMVRLIRFERDRMGCTIRRILGLRTS